MNKIVDVQIATTDTPYRITFSDGTVVEMVYGPREVLDTCGTTCPCFEPKEQPNAND